MGYHPDGVKVGNLDLALLANWTLALEYVGAGTDLVDENVTRCTEREEGPSVLYIYARAHACTHTPSDTRTHTHTHTHTHTFDVAVLLVVRVHIVESLQDTSKDVSDIRHDDIHPLVGVHGV